MLKKTITYKNFNDEEVSEDFYFHLSEAELVELEVSHQGGLSDALQRIIEAEDNKRLMEEFQNIILASYGKRSEDGKRFRKNDEVRQEFKEIGAYSALFMDLVTNTDSAIEFVNGIIPDKMTERMAQIGAAAAEDKPELAAVPEPQIVTPKDIDEMSPEEIKELGARIQSGEVKLTNNRS